MRTSPSSSRPSAWVAGFVLVGGCAAAALPATSWSGGEVVADPAAPQLARFMRELVNVPFSFALLEQGGAQRTVRCHGAALVLQEAVRDLVAWEDPPVGSPEGRDVFYAYARHLEHQVAQLELATRHHDTAATGARLEDIRETCNSCHRFFRPATALSADVGYDTLATGEGALR